MSNREPFFGPDAFLYVILFAAAHRSAWDFGGLWRAIPGPFNWSAWAAFAGSFWSLSFWPPDTCVQDFFARPSSISRRMAADRERPPLPFAQASTAL